MIALGYSLVSLPKFWWNWRDINNIQSYYEYQVGDLDAQVKDIFYELELEVKGVFHISKKAQAKPYLPILNEILINFPDEIKRDFAAGLDSYFSPELLGEMLRKLSESYCVERRSRINYLVKMYQRQKWKKMRGVQIAIDLNHYTRNYGTDSFVAFSEQKFAWMQLKKLYFFWLRKPMYLCLYAISVFLSVVVFGSELLLFSNYNLGFVKDYMSQYNYYLFQVVAMSPYYYAVTAVYFALFKVKIDGVVGLYAGHNTDSAS